jgi:hypothetical protein
MSFIKDNGGPLVVGAAVVAICGVYFELRLAAELPDAVAGQTSGIPSSDKIEAIEGDVADLKANLKTESEARQHYDDKMDDKITRIIDILLEE